MIGRGSLAGRVSAMERAGGAGQQLVVVIRRFCETGEDAMLRRYGPQGPPKGARVLVVYTGVERADDYGVEP